MKPIFKFLLSIAIPVSVGIISGLFTANSVDTWYTTLNRPSFAPPNEVFGPVWTTLYLLMGISLYMVWRQPASDIRNKAIGIFAIQLTLNFFWSFLFFYLHNPGAALIDIVVLWLTIIIMLIRFHRCKPLAAWLNIPYLLWVSFASMLNLAFYQLN